MSTFKKNMLAAALVAGMGLAGTAAAYSLLTGGNTTPEAVATQAGAAFTMTEAVAVRIDLGDAIIGRTTGFQVKVTLEGARFAADPVLTLGEAANQALQGGWATSPAAGTPAAGGTGASIAQYSVNPETASSNVVDGILGTFSAFQLNQAPGDVYATIEIIDPVTGTGLHTRRIQIVDRVDGFDFVCTENETANRIDVGTNEAYPDQKTGFVVNPWAIGDASTNTASLGTIGIDVTGTSLAAGDTFESVITGNFDGFDAVFLGDADCTVTVAAYTINTAGTTATLETTMGALGWAPAGGEHTLCVTVDGETMIEAQTLSVVNSINGEVDATEEACVVSPIAYNGSVVDVYTINPAGVSSAQSFVRVINPSSVEGKVTIEAWDDAGVKAPVNVTFDLGPRQSLQVNSEDLENGNTAKGLTGAWGNGAGKWRARVTGEFSGMRVSSLNRNTTDGTVTNLTDADGHGEQLNDKAAD